jgi:ABC-2 type transport system permease protein
MTSSHKTSHRPDDVKHPVVELIQARLREFYREPAILFWVFGFPLVMALGLGVAFRSRPVELPEVAVSSDENAANKALESLLLGNKDIHARALPFALAQVELAHAKVDILVELRGEGAVYHFDPMQERAAGARLAADNALQTAAGRKNPLPTENQIGTKKGTRYIDFLIPGLIAMNLMGSSLWSIGFNLVMQRKRRLLRRYAVTPMKRWHLLLSYVATRLMFLVAEVTVLGLFGRLLFGTVIQGSVFTVLVVSLLGGASFAGLGLLVGARTANTETASGWMNVVQLPMWVLSGPFFSYERFPEWAHPLLEALPLTALANALRAVYNEGAGLLSLGPELLVLVLWGTLPFLLAMRLFRWQ